MPAAACPGIVQRYGNLPFGNTTFSVADLPGDRNGVFLPLILKSCVVLPRFVTTNVTAPLGTIFLDSTNLNSDAATVTLVAAAELLRAPPAAAKTPKASTTRTNVVSTAISGV